ncbi:acetyltransferase-like isoleucine patch superfamily enzyme [Motilibacter peucedani]|uniref:Acetyltransferase-like isoleucine patch superfamily enzyme n=1 Tax=Motilibacter peucedani TaxID=598650 RepID=A0A420XLX0_9ACTN|nr:acyltransferase [Motilibacter peucedani]RKS71311.1 acetyltransferase-like isoleucine patch superfamily enzyme [Motilibacter peucedani]
MPKLTAQMVRPACRTVLLRARHRRIRGSGFLIHRGAEIVVEPGATFWVGASTQILRDATITVQGTLRIGSKVFANRGLYLSARHSVEIGDRVQIGEYVSIHDENHAFDNPDLPILHQGFVTEPVVIEEDAWVGSHSVVLPGVRIGEGAVVGAGAVVTRDIPRGAVAVGVPARVVSYRPGFGPLPPEEAGVEVEAAHVATANTMRLSL